MKYGTVIFDLDGTISDPSLGIVRCANFALESLGYESVDGSQIRPLIGPPLQELFAALVGDVPDEVIRALIDKYRERYGSIGYAENTLYDGIENAVSEISSRGHELGVCTSKRTDFAERILEMFELRRYFEFVDGGDIGIKKSEQISQLVDNGLEPESAVMVGDRAVDILAARRNGIASLGVLWGFGDSLELSGARADSVVGTPAELIEVLGSLQ